MDSSGANQEASSRSIELKQTYEDLQAKNHELKEAIKYLQTENLGYEQKYQILRQRVTTLNDLLDKNATVFFKLFHDAKSALQVGRLLMLDSPAPAKRTLPSIQAPKPGPSAIAPAHNLPLRPVTRRKLHIEPLNMQELQEEASEEQVEPEVGPVETSDLSQGLSVIQEESTVRDAKELTVRVERLSADVIEQHLRKSNSRLMSSVSTLNGSLSLSSKSLSDLSSTPFKLEAMRELGLTPSPILLEKIHIRNFINLRRKHTGDSEGGSRKNSTLVSPKQERISSPPKRLTGKRSSNVSLTPQFVNKRKKTSAETRPVEVKTSPKDPQRTPDGRFNAGSKSPKRGGRVKTIPKSPETEPTGRPTRRAKPQSLKEPELKKKMRRC